MMWDGGQQLLIEMKRYQLFKRAIIGQMRKFHVSVLWLSDFNICLFGRVFMLLVGVVMMVSMHCHWSITFDHFYSYRQINTASIGRCGCISGSRVCAVHCAYHSFVCFRLPICPYLTHYQWYAMVGDIVEA